MGRPDFPLTIVDFQARFASEEACRDYLFDCRWPEGFRCPRCGGEDAGEMHRRRWVWQCKRCGHQTSVTAGTVMHKTHTPLRLWFWAAYLVATHNPGISAKQLSRQRGIRYETAWLMLQKLRRAMVAPEREPLRREVEVDEFYVGGPEGQWGRHLGTEKALCAVAVEVRGNGSGRARLAVVEDLSWRSLGGFVQATIEPEAIVHTDAWRSYLPLGRAGFEHRPIRREAVLGHEPYLPRAHRAISNLKTWLLGTHRRASRQHLQVYLDEFTFRHNRRRTPMAAFQTLLGLSAIHEPSTYRQITQRAA